jgi:glutaredoxin
VQKTVFLLFALLSCVVMQAQSGIYKWTDENGKVHFSDAAPENLNAESIQVSEINTFENVSIADAPDWNGFFKPPKANAKHVLIYSTESCGACKRAKRYFEQHNIPYTERKVDEDTSARKDFDEMGGRGVPIIFVGQKRMDGFSSDKFAALYAKENPPNE